MVPGLSIPPWGHSTGGCAAPQPCCERNIWLWQWQELEAEQPQHWGCCCPQKQSHRSVVRRGFSSLTLCWQQPMATQQLHSPVRVPAPPRQDFLGQSSVVVPVSPLFPQKVSRVRWNPSSRCQREQHLLLRQPWGDAAPLQEPGPAGRAQDCRQSSAEQAGCSARVPLGERLPGRLA